MAQIGLIPSYEAHQNVDVNGQPVVREDLLDLRTAKLPIYEVRLKRTVDTGEPRTNTPRKMLKNRIQRLLKLCGKHEQLQFMQWRPEKTALQVQTTPEAIALVSQLPEVATVKIYEPFELQA